MSVVTVPRLSATGEMVVAKIEGNRDANHLSGAKKLLRLRCLVQLEMRLTGGLGVVEAAAAQNQVRERVEHSRFCPILRCKQLIRFTLAVEEVEGIVL